MINVLKKTLQIDYAYSVNSFIYVLQRLPIFSDLLTKDAYSSKLLKNIQINYDIDIQGKVFSITFKPNDILIKKEIEKLSEMEKKHIIINQLISC